MIGVYICVDSVKTDDDDDDDELSFFDLQYFLYYVSNITCCPKLKLFEPSNHMDHTPGTSPVLTVCQKVILVFYSLFQ